MVYKGIFRRCSMCLCLKLMHDLFHSFPPLLTPTRLGNVVDSSQEESVLRQLESHLHVALCSRSAELNYLHSLVHTLLPLVSQPPLLSPTAKLVKTARDDDAAARNSEGRYPFSAARTNALTRNRNHTIFKTIPEIKMDANR